MNAKRQKLIDQFARDAATSSNVDKKSDIFEGVRIFVNGFTSPPAADLRMMMMEHGGIFDTYYVRDVTTHIVVSSMANSKQKIFDKHRCVSADWITESIRAGKLLDWRLFQFKSGVVKGQKGAAANSGLSRLLRRTSCLSRLPHWMWNPGHGAGVLCIG